MHFLVFFFFLHLYPKSYCQLKADSSSNHYEWTKFDPDVVLFIVNASLEFPVWFNFHIVSDPASTDARIKQLTMV